LRESTRVASPDGRLALALSCALVAAILIAYAPVRDFEFVSFDDPQYVTANPHVRAGLTLEGVWWAFTAAHAANWHPLTWLSHMADVEVFGLRPGFHHAVSVVLHALTTVLLFAFFRSASGDLWPSAFVAAVFGLHPLHVESVAWVAERKDVLSACFFALTLWSWLAWVRRPAANRRLLTLVVFGLGLLSKPMLVTLPLVLVLLDRWPLGRMASPRDLAARVGEKLPLFAVAGAAAVATFLAQHGAGAVVALERLPVLQRLANALVAYVAYAGATVWPARLAIFYPYQNRSTAMAAGAAVVLAAISIGVVLVSRRAPAVLVGWLWYLVTLAPVVGLVQVGSQSLADRFTYLPQTGLALMLAWGVPAIVPAEDRWRRATAVAAAAAVGVCLLLSARQVSHWRDSETLFRRALAVTEGNYLAHNSLGVALAQRGRLDEAHGHYAEAVRLNPRFAEAHANLGNALYRARDLARAEHHYREALRLRPDLPDAHNGLAGVLADAGKLEAATEHYRRALALRPEFPEAHLNLGNALRRLGRCGEATAEYRVVTRQRPDWADARFGLGICLAAAGDPAAGERELREALRLAPGWFPAAEALARLLATSPAGDPEEAIRLAELARSRAGEEDARLLDTLAAAYAAAGRFSEAAEVARRAVGLARDAGDERLAVEVEGRLRGYEDRGGR
jgi:tetratricopeptide (TPR) repeat protein